MNAQSLEKNIKHWRGQRLIWYKQLPLITAILMIGSLNVLAASNPNRGEYIDYAVERFNSHSESSNTNFCSNKPLSEFCQNVVDGASLAVGFTTKQVAKNTIDQTTKRHNYVFFSIYETQLDKSNPEKANQAKTIGILGNFWTLAHTPQEESDK